MAISTIRAEPGSDHYSQQGQEQTRSRLRHIERREWWLWATAVMITLLLTAGILSFLPMLLQSNERSDYFFTLRRAMWGLLGMVLLFDVYTVYQQLQIHRMRRRLFEREELFRLISDNAADMIAVVDMDGNRIYNSQSYSRVLGYDEDELKHSSSFEQVHPDDREMVRKAAEDARRTGIGRTLEYRIRHKDGSWRVLESTASVIRTPRGEAQKLVIVNRDITERKEAAESLRQSESGFRSMVEDAPYGIFRCHSNGKLLSANPAFQRMLRYDYPDELLQTNLVEDVFDSPWEFQKLKNLVDDGKEFKDVAVELRRKDGNKITVLCRGRSVTDPEGLPSFDVFAEDVTETLVHIFEPFFTTNELGKGTGLGLATVYGVVKQSEGYVWVDSELGKGASFQIFLPRVEEEQTAQVPMKTLEGQGAGASETILLVEDSEPLRKLTRSFLESHGFDVLVAQNGEEAIDVEARTSKKIHLLLTDVVMPGINGRVLAERLHLKQREMKVLYISGYTDSFIAIHGVLERGMTLLNKPYTEDELVQKVRETLRRRAGESNDESLPAISQGRPHGNC